MYTGGKGGQQCRTAEIPQLTLDMSWFFTAQRAHGCAASRGSMGSLHSLPALQGWLQPQDFVTWTLSSVALALVMTHDLVQKERPAKMTNLGCRSCVQINSLSLQSFQFPRANLRRLQGKKKQRKALFIHQSSVYEMFNLVNKVKLVKHPGDAQNFCSISLSDFFIYLRCQYNCIWNIACLSPTEAFLDRME